MRIMIESSPVGGYVLVIEYGENKFHVKPEVFKYLYDVLDSAFYNIDTLEHETGQRYDLVISSEATRQNRDKDIAFWKRLNDPTVRPTLPRLIRDRREIEE
jgi:hypothetical protein